MRENYTADTASYAKAVIAEAAEGSRGSGELWHYTSARAILSIFQDYIKGLADETAYVHKCSFLASNIRFMNDAKEYSDGLEIYKKLLQDGTILKDKTRLQNLCDASDFQMDSMYLVSFCGNGDLLSQWKWYGKDSGVALKFNFKSAYCSISHPIEENGKTDGINHSPLSDAHGTKPSDVYGFTDAQMSIIPVRYTEREKKKYLQQLLGTKYENYPNSSRVIPMAFVPFCKDAGFSEEKESRLVFFACNPQGRCSYNIEYNTAELGRIKPALHVNVSNQIPTAVSADIIRPNALSKKHVPPNSQNLISQIVVGPGQNQNLVFNLMIHIFDRSNYRFHEETESERAPISEEEFSQKAKSDRTVYNVNWLSKPKSKVLTTRLSYLCENGIVIMKSSTPFRG